MANLDTDGASADSSEQHELKLVGTADGQICEQDKNDVSNDGTRKVKVPPVAEV